jgi:Trypsin
MPNQRIMGLRWGLAFVAAFVAVAACCPAAQAIVGGQSVPITDAPYQVALVAHGDTNAHGQFCGGIISKDGTHIITAAHCVYDTGLSVPGQAVAPASIDVVSGTATLSNDQSQRTAVSAVSFDPRFDPVSFSHDAALLTLASPLTFGSTVKKLPAIMNENSLAAAPVGTEFRVSGWGQRADGTYPSNLQLAPVPLVLDATCGPSYAGFDAAVMVCAGDESHDACFGDSGGPLISQTDPPTPTTELVGIVSFGGETCADGSYPGVYTQAPDPSTRDFILQSSPESAPRQLDAPSVQGAPIVGQTVSCAPGTWSGAGSFSYQFVSGSVARAALGAGAQYLVQQADLGQPLSCVVRAVNAGGFALATSAPTTPVTAPANPQPDPAPQPQPTPEPQPQPTPQPQPQQDIASPVARITSSRCTSTRCTLNVTVTDAGFSAGIKAVTASVRSTYMTTCKRNGTSVKCTKRQTRKPSVTSVSANRFRVVASKLPVGTHVFTLVAVDKAGHRQALPTRKTLRTKAKKTATRR